MNQPNLTKLRLFGLMLLVTGMWACDSEKKSPPIAEAKSDADNSSSQAMHYEPFPDGYGYLQDSVQLIQAVMQNDRKTVREHGWNMWAGITQPASSTDWPLWFTWPNTQPAFAPLNQSLKSVMNSESLSLIGVNVENQVFDTAFASLLPIYPIPEPVKEKYGTDFSIGSRFLFNGDIMIPTEALSLEAYEWIRKDSIFLKSKLQKMYEDGVPSLKTPKEYISTKHMYWPVKQTGYSALPVWNFDYPATYDRYAGYENWSTIVAIDPTGQVTNPTVEITYLHGVLNPDSTEISPITKTAPVVPIQDFYYHQVTEDEWNNVFDDADRAILNASSYWAHNQPFEPGDYLATIAMHVNTKELPYWTMQSVWWSNKPDLSQYAKNRPDLPQAEGPWDHYLMTTSYGILDPETGKLPAEFNPYIELVIHPVGTSCQNCHIRAGWPKAPSGHGTPGMASYQNDDCPDLLEPLTTDSECLQEYLLTDFSWIIPDQAVD